MPRIAVVVPTIRPECWEEFVDGWSPLFEKHQVDLIKVQDGDNPLLTHYGCGKRGFTNDSATATMIMGNDRDLIFNENDGVRNLGFAYVAQQLPKVETIITLDDDTLPIGDPIQQHLDVLDRRFPLSWMSTATDYVRGIPYKVRDEAECTVSHGVWMGSMDLDAPTQLVKGNRQLGFYKGAIPRGIYFPLCGMNVAFKRKMLPYMYYAPMGHRVGIDRFADIWLGINLKRVCDGNDWAIATGYSTVRHDRASNVWKNLEKEVTGLKINETYWSGDESATYFQIYNSARKRWKVWVDKQL